ncbi:MAG: hypothetical protein P4L34_02985 [Paludibacter sp.]|nr:hypothetical protein [Paludibacter sp.]
MNEKRKFTCKLEDVPAIAGYLALRLRADLIDFADFSDVFSENYVTGLVAKTTQCNQLISSNVLTKEIKTLTDQIGNKAKSLRVMLNKLDVYLDMADGQMTVSAKSIGTKLVRDSIETGNSEGIVAQIRRLLVGVNNNAAVLQSKGLKPALIAEMSQLADDMESLGNEQNFKITERNRHTDENIAAFNELWDMNVFITDTGKALYKGVDATKLSDYTMTTILKRIGTGKSGNTNTPETPAT